MGGYGTNLKKERLTYHLGDDLNIKGLILASNPPLYKLIEKRMGDKFDNIYKTVFEKSNTKDDHASHKAAVKTSEL
jgi:hypothetical protein